MVVTRGLRDIWFGAFAIAVGALLWWETTKPKYQVDKVQDYGFDPAFFPRILIVMWILLAAAMILRGLTRLKLPADEQDWRTLAGALACTFAYAAAINWIGFLFASIAFAAVIIPLLGFRKPLIALAIASLFPLATWYCFVFLLKIPLPASPWFTRM